MFEREQHTSRAKCIGMRSNAGSGQGSACRHHYRWESQYKRGGKRLRPGRSPAGRKSKTSVARRDISDVPNEFASRDLPALCVGWH